MLSYLTFAFIARKMLHYIFKNMGWGRKGAKEGRGGNRGSGDWWVCPSSENPIYVYSLHPPFLPLPECSQMSSRCSPELRSDTSYSSKKLLRSMHIHIHVPMLVCCHVGCSMGRCQDSAIVGIFSFCHGSGVTGDHGLLWTDSAPMNATRFVLCFNSFIDVCSSSLICLRSSIISHSSKTWGDAVDNLSSTNKLLIARANAERIAWPICQATITLLTNELLIKPLK